MRLHDETTRDEGAGATAARPVDRARIDRLSKAIDDGTYTADPELIAEKLIDGGFPGAVNR